MAPTQRSSGVASGRRRIALAAGPPREGCGLATYNAQLARALARHAAVEVIDAERLRAQPDEYERVLYCVDGPADGGPLRTAMEQHSGVLIAHDVRVALDLQPLAEMVIVPSRHAVASMQRDGLRAGADDPPVRVVAHALPWTRPQFRRPWRDVPLVLCFGTVGYDRGLQTLLEAAALLSESHPAMRLILAGRAPQHELRRWLGLAGRLGLGGRVDIPGFVGDEQYEDLLAQATLAVQLRTSTSGEASDVVARNLGAGVPTIVTDVGWFSELPRDAVVHVARDVPADALASEIDRLLTDERHAATVTRGARRHADRTSFLRAARELHRAVLGPPASGRRPLAPLRPARATVVVITNDRCDRVLLALQALHQQDCADFAVVVADDGSTDATREEVELLAQDEDWRGRLLWVGVPGGPSGGGGRPRNAGAGSVAPATELLIFMDVDVLVAPDAIGLMLELHDRHPGAVQFGTVHWLAPLDIVDVALALDRGVPTLLDRVPDTEAVRVDGTVVGRETRAARHFAPAATVRPRPVEPELALSGLEAIPIAVFEDIGRYDHELVGYGYEDMEFGIRLQRAGVSALCVSDIYGLHVWHAKHDWSRMVIESERNLDYVLRKHGADATSDEWADWSVWWHYHADRGGRVVRDGSARLWGVDRGDRVRLLLPDAEWVTRLGRSVDEIGAISDEALTALRDAGEAHELALQRSTPVRA